MLVVPANHILRLNGLECNFVPFAWKNSSRLAFGLRKCRSRFRTRPRPFLLPLLPNKSFPFFSAVLCLTMHIVSFLFLILPRRLMCLGLNLMMTRVSFLAFSPLRVQRHISLLLRGRRRRAVFAFATLGRTASYCFGPCVLYDKISAIKSVVFGVDQGGSGVFGGCEVDECKSIMMDVSSADIMEVKRINTLCRDRCLQRFPFEPFATRRPWSSPSPSHLPLRPVPLHLSPLSFSGVLSYEPPIAA